MKNAIRRARGGEGVEKLHTFDVYAKSIITRYVHALSSLNNG